MSESATVASFPREARLVNAAQYSRVFRKSRRKADRYWTILIHETGDSSSKLGLAIAKKRARRAVDRNLLKRIAREQFRKTRGSLAGKHLVVMNRDAAVTASRCQLRESLDSLFGQISH